MLFVSHDRYFVNQVADHLLIVEPGRVRVIEGNYDTYLHLRSAGWPDARVGVGRADEGRVGRSGCPADRKGSRRKRRFPYRKPEEIEVEIHEREARQQGLLAL